MKLRIASSLVPAIGLAIVAAVIASRAVGVETFNHDVGDKRIVKEATVAAPVAAVWQAWTDPEVIAEFLAPKARVELRVGGAYELLFLLDNPQGSRGCEGCTVLTYVPEKLLSFSWSAPPKFADARPLHTWVVVEFERVDPSQTLVRLTHYGFGRGDEWDRVHAYFDRAWGSVMASLVDHFAAKKLVTSRAGG